MIDIYKLNCCCWNLMWCWKASVIHTYWIRCTNTIGNMSRMTEKVKPFYLRFSVKVLTISGTSHLECENLRRSPVWWRIDSAWPCLTSLLFLWVREEKFCLKTFRGSWCRSSTIFLSCHGEITGISDQFCQKLPRLCKNAENIYLLLKLYTCSPTL